MERINALQTAPGAVKALHGVHRYLLDCGLEHKLLYLIFVRASQVNGCAFCIDMHWKEAVDAGHEPQRLYMLDAWREWPEGYSDRERAALAWTEAITRITDGHAPDDVYRVARDQFTERELVDLTLAVTNINAWNRMAIAFRKKAGDFQVGKG